MAKETHGFFLSSEDDTLRMQHVRLPSSSSILDSELILVNNFFMKQQPYSPFLPEDQWKQRRVDEQREYIVAEIQRKKNKELLESLARLNRRMNNQK